MSRHQGPPSSVTKSNPFLTPVYNPHITGKSGRFHHVNGVSNSAEERTRLQTVVTTVTRQIIPIKEEISYEILTESNEKVAQKINDDKNVNDNDNTTTIVEKTIVTSII